MSAARRQRDATEPLFSSFNSPTNHSAPLCFATCRFGIHGGRITFRPHRYTFPPFRLQPPSDTDSPTFLFRLIPRFLLPSLASLLSSQREPSPPSIAKVFSSRKNSRRTESKEDFEGDGSVFSTRRSRHPLPSFRVSPVTTLFPLRRAIRLAGTRCRRIARDYRGFKLSACGSLRSFHLCRREKAIDSPAGENVYRPCSCPPFLNYIDTSVSLPWYEDA